RLTPSRRTLQNVADSPVWGCAYAVGASPASRRRAPSKLRRRGCGGRGGRPGAGGGAVGGGKGGRGGGEGQGGECVRWGWCRGGGGWARVRRGGGAPGESAGGGAWGGGGRDQAQGGGLYAAGRVSRVVIRCTVRGSSGVAGFLK